MSSELLGPSAHLQRRVRPREQRAASWTRNVADACANSVAANTRTEVRVLFAFDPKRLAILLVGDDNSHARSTWYEVNVLIADERYDAHLRGLNAEQGQPRKRSRKRGR